MAQTVNTRDAILLKFNNHWRFAPLEDGAYISKRAARGCGGDDEARAEGGDTGV